MVRVHGYRESRLSEEMSELVEGVHDGEELFVMDIPVLFMVFELVMEHDNWAEFSIWSFLADDASVSFIGGISLEEQRQIGVEGGEEYILADSGEEAAEGRLVELGVPGEGHIFLEQGV